MKLHRRPLRFVAMAVVISLPLLGMSGVASAKAAKGCHKTHTCQSGGGSSTGSGTGADPAPITVQIDPNPLVETGQSLIGAVIQVETSPSFAGDLVNIDSSQLQSACGGAIFLYSNASGPLTGFVNNIQVALDDDGNATVLVTGINCAPGSSVIDASMTTAPYDTALTTLVANPPVVTTPGVYGYPTTSGTVTTGEVETGDSASSGDSDVIAVFYVETSPVYAEQPVEISSPELASRCGDDDSVFDGLFVPTGAGSSSASATLDDDGNAVFLFWGASCAAGSSVVTADVVAGTHPTYTNNFNIVAPQPTI
jgi:hypothetical protein